MPKPLFHYKQQKSVLKILITIVRNHLKVPRYKVHIYTIDKKPHSKFKA